jgi:hypothetical protein
VELGVQECRATTETRTHIWVKAVHASSSFKVKLMLNDSINHTYIHRSTSASLSKRITNRPALLPTKRTTRAPKRLSSSEAKVYCYY